MSKTLEDIRIDFNNSIAGNYELRQARARDYRFAFVNESQWEGSYAENFENKPRPVFNKTCKYIMRLVGQKQRTAINARIISASDEAVDEDAEILQSLWRNDSYRGEGSDAIEMADLEAFTCGFGAYKVVSKFEDEENPDSDKQYLGLEPISSAISSVFHNAGAIKKNKSDATQCWQLVRTNRKLVEDEFGVTVSSYPTGVSNDYFNWNTDSTKDIYIAHYYEIVINTITIYTFDINGAEFVVTVRAGKILDQEGNELTKDELKSFRDDADDEEIVRRKEKVVEYSLLAGDQFLIKPRRTPFKTIPIKVQYGYHIVINGIEYYWGEATMQRDPQLYFNSYMSAMMQLMAEPQNAKPEYLPEQIARHANQRTKINQDNPAFLMSDPVKDAAGNVTHMGPIAIHQPPAIGSGLQASGAQLESLMAELGGTGQSTLPANVSAEAVEQINQRADDTYQTLFQNSMNTIKEAAYCWISAAQVLYFSNPRNLRALAEDGSFSQVKTLQHGVDDQGNIGLVKNTAKGKFDVEVKKGESYQTKKEAEFKAAKEMLPFTDPASPIGQIVLNDAILAQTGEGMDDAKRLARFNNISIMMAQGIDPKAKTEEEEAFVGRKIQEQQQAEQSQKDPNLIMAEAESQARIMEGQAALQNEENDANANQIKAAELQLKAAALDLKDKELQIKAAEAGVKIENTNADTASKIADVENKRVDTASKQIDNSQKIFSSLSNQIPAL